MLETGFSALLTLNFLFHSCLDSLSSGVGFVNMYFPSKPLGFILNGSNSLTCIQTVIILSHYKGKMWANI